MGASFAHLMHDGFTDSLFILFPLWAKAFSLTYAEVGLLKMVMSSCLSIFQIPSGLLSEKFGEKNILVVGTLIASSGFILIWFVTGFFSLLGCLMIIGLGASTQHPVGSALVSTVFRKNKRSALGIYNFSGDLGKVIFPVSVASLSAAYSWYISTFTVGIVGVLGAILIFFMLQSEVKGKGGKEPNVKNTVIKKGWAITNGTGFICLSCISMIDTSVRLSFLTYLPFLLIEKGADISTGGFALTLVFSGGAVGKLVCGLFSERFGIIKAMVITEIATGLGLLILIFLPIQLILIFLPIFGIFLNGTSSVIYGSVGDFVDHSKQARAFGLFYTLGIGAGAISPFIYGLIVDQLGLAEGFKIMAGSLISLVPLFFLLSSEITDP